MFAVLTLMALIGITVLVCFYKLLSALDDIAEQKSGVVNEVVTSRPDLNLQSHTRFDSVPAASPNFS